MNSIDRILPHAPDAEKGVLGSILLSPADCLGECIEKLKCGPEMMYDLRHQNLFRVLIEMYDERVPIDLITVRQRLKDGGKLEDCGGMEYIAGLPDMVPSATGLDWYLKMVIEKYRLRQLIQTCTALVGRAYENDKPVDEFMDEAERDIFRICEDQAQAEIVPARELVKNAITRIEDYHKNKGKLTGIGTGFVDFDKQTTGLHGGEMFIVAARTSVGKTSWAMNVVEHVTCELKLPTGVFSLEMTDDQLIERMLCSRARVNARNITAGFLTDDDFPKLTRASGNLAAAPVWIYGRGGLTLLQMRAKARRMVQQYGVKLFVIDYLQLLTIPGYGSNRQAEVSAISTGIKSLAMELNVPFLVLSQLNRDVEKRGVGARPRLSDLRESGSIEQDADGVAFLFREKASVGDDDERDESDIIPVGLDVAKQRNGPTGLNHLTFFKCHTRFESAAKVEKEDAPRSHPRKKERSQHANDRD